MGREGARKWAFLIVAVLGGLVMAPAMGARARQAPPQDSEPIRPPEMPVMPEMPRAPSAPRAPAVAPVLPLNRLPKEPIVGERRVCVLLVKFLDANPQLSHTPAYFQRRLFSAEEPLSLASYFDEVSYGRLRLTGDAFGWFLAREDPGTSDEAMATAKNKSDYTDPYTLVQEVLALADPVVDFSQYDLDRDGVVDFLFLILADSDGGTEPELFQTPRTFAFTIEGQQPLQTADGVYIDWFSVFNESSGLGYMVREFLHLCGMPDLDGSPQGIPPRHVGVGFWSVMGTGYMLGPPDPITGEPDGSVPGHPDPWTKIALGWVEPKVIIAPGKVELPAVEEEPVVYKIPVGGDPEAKEYFLIENRQRIGFDRYLPGAGLLIWHVDERVLEHFTQPDGTYTNWLTKDPIHPFISVVQADGRNDLSSLTPVQPLPDGTMPINLGGNNHGDEGDPFPGSTLNRLFTKETDPPALTFDGHDAGVTIVDISDPGPTMVAYVGCRLRLVLLLPPEGSSVETVRPTLVAKVERILSDAPDLDPHSVAVAIDGQEVEVEGREEIYDPLRKEIRAKLPPLPYGLHTMDVVAKDREGNPVVPISARFFVRPRVLPAGIQMIAIPYLLDNPDASYVLSIPSPKVARWDPVSATYRYYPERIAKDFLPGAGYWVKLDSSITIRLEGEEVDVARPFTIPLRAGWNQIGNPFPFEVGWNSAEVVHEGRRLSLSEAVKEGWISGVIYWYEPPRYRWARAPEGTLLPWRGYWVRAFVDCDLVLPPIPGSAQLRAAGPSPLAYAEFVLEGPWGRVEDGGDAMAVMRGASEGLDPFDVEEPPPSPEAVGRLSLLREGRSLTCDATGSSRSKWTLKVESPPRRPLRIRVAKLKGADAVGIFDPVVGKEVLLRCGEAYALSLRPGEGRRLLKARFLRASGRARVVSLRLLRLRGGLAAEVVVTRSGRVKVELLTPSGRVVARSAEVSLPSGRGVVPLRLEGAGPPPAGTYVLRARIKDAAGNEARKAKVVVLR